MSSTLSSLLLMRLNRTRRTRRAPDPADMGTAFGLEYILDQAREDPDAAAPEAAAPRATPWLRRWWQGKPGR